MTDGILLAEIGSDRDLLQLRHADHRRGARAQPQHRLPPRLPEAAAPAPPRPQGHHHLGHDRPASASPSHFGATARPIVEVSGRTYPVEVRYRPDQRPTTPRRRRPRPGPAPSATPSTSSSHDGPGDILVFLSGEREIRETADALKGRAEPRGPPALLPPLRRRTAARLRAPQPRISSRRVVLATNVAETSLTVPGIRYVIDPGLARISRYSLRTKVQRLPIEPISQASANQRKGRCGRVADGICIRLYSEEDFASRPEFTDPEILRTNLAASSCRWPPLGLGDIRAFPFLDPPDPRSIADGVELLEELSADERATGSPNRPQARPPARRPAHRPHDPRIRRSRAAPARSSSSPPPCPSRTRASAPPTSSRPPTPRTAGSPSPNPTSSPSSPSGTTSPSSQRELSGSAFRRMCRAEFLNYLRVREWQDLHGQLQKPVRRSRGQDQRHHHQNERWFTPPCSPDSCPM